MQRTDEITTGSRFDKKKKKNHIPAIFAFDLVARRDLVPSERSIVTNCFAHFLKAYWTLRLPAELTGFILG